MGSGDILDGLVELHASGSEALESIDAEVIVLDDEADLLSGEVLLDVVTHDLCFHRIGGEEREESRVLPLISESAETCIDEERRYATRTETDLAVDSEVVRGTERSDDREDLVAQDQLIRLDDCLLWQVAVIFDDQLDLSTIDTAIGVDVVEVRLRCWRDLGVARSCDTGHRHRDSQLHRVRCDAWF